MAWTKQRPNGKYQGVCRIPGVGERSAGVFDHEQQAFLAAAKLEEKLRKPGAVDPKSSESTLGDWWHEFDDSRTLAYTSHSAQASIASNHVLPHWESTRLCDIKEIGGLKWIKEMASDRGGQGCLCTKEKKSVWLIHLSLQLMNTILNGAVRHERLEKNPFKGIDRPTLPDGLERYATPEEIEAISFQMDGLNATILKTAVGTGMRPGEIFGLHRRRVNFDQGMIHVTEQYEQKEKVVKLLKDKESRWVPMDHDLGKTLWHFYNRPGEVRATCGITHLSGPCTGDLLFRGPRGAPISSKEWGRGPFSRAKVSAGIEGRFRVYDLRHTYASWLLQQDVTLPELMLLLGHSEYEMTLRYAHFAKKQVFDQVRAALGRHRRGLRRDAGRDANAVTQGYAALYSSPGEEAI
jgi:integrase